MAERRLQELPELARFADDLNALGYRNAEQFLGAASVSEVALAEYLGIDVNALRTIVAGIKGPVMLVAGKAQRPKFPLGVRLDAIRRPAVSLMRAPGAAAALPAEVNHIADMQPIRHQGDRGTCVAHAAGAVGEHYWHKQGRVVDLSRQFLYWACKQHDGMPDAQGTWIDVAMSRLMQNGCCLEDTWPYVMTVDPGNEAQNPPPGRALTEALTYKVERTRQLSPTSVADIKATLAANCCVAFSISVFNSWYQNNEVTRTGDIVNPIPGEMKLDQGHAMCFVGYRDALADAASGGGHFYLRNSWGTSWASESSLGRPGYGTIPYSYIASNCVEAYSIP
jgi:C1A family cysteine protease